ncbi:MAG: ribonuclease HI [Alphaproteobacteria bacterium]|tara:strand:- start:3136 stop:3570 length:435 start_codon:yes stop_codon:yes gene_type:complete
MDKEAIVYTDGACSGNPGPGGWGATIKLGDETFEIFGGEDNTTNNRMELIAAIKALEYLNENHKITLYTDSNYVKDGITKWIFNWKKNNWKTSTKKPVKNSDLWIQLDEIQNKREVKWNWVKGHAGNLGNERADELARMGIKEI